MPRSWNLRSTSHGASALSTAGGQWFHELFIQAGASSHLAHLIVTFVLAPLEVLVAIVGGFILARYGARALRRIFAHYLKTRSARSGEDGQRLRLTTIASVSANIWRFAVAIFTIAIVLSLIGINLTPLLASATVIGATLGFGAQTLVRDYLSGFLLTVEDQFAIGETIAVNSVSGTVEEISLRVTRLRTDDGSIVFIPNGEIRVMINRSRDWAIAVCEVPMRPLGSERSREVLAQLRDALEGVGQSSGLAASDITVTPSVASDKHSSTVRITARTAPTDRASIAHRLRQRAVACLVETDAWPGDEP